MGFLSKSKIKATELVEQAVSKLGQLYDNHEGVFTAASPFGQILIVLSNMVELVMTYISHALEDLNIKTVHTPEGVHGLAALTGHNAYRGGAARGAIQVKLNTSAPSVVAGSYVKILNHSKVNITENDTIYFMQMPTDWVRLSIDSPVFTNIQIIEGELETQTFVSDGTELQSFSPIIKGMSDHDSITVTVNGKEWQQRESLYDMNEHEEAFICKTSVSVGVMVFFGNDAFGKIPPYGSQIDITYIKTIGMNGNLNTNQLHYEFIDSGVDEFGNEINLNEVLQVNTMSAPVLGADYENPDFTRLIAPRASKSFVLATPENYISYLSRYNQFSTVDAYNTKDDAHVEDDNVTYLTILPDVKKKFSNSYDYFSLPEQEYLLSDFEKQAVYKTLDDSGRMLVNSEVQIIDYDIHRYVINVAVKYFETYNTNDIKEHIRDVFNTYFQNINRSDIIPVSDLVSLVESIEGVDTCNVFFLTEENEKAKITGAYKRKVHVWSGSKLKYEYRLVDVKVPTGVDPRVGFDELGNIVYDRGILMLPRGGWVDADGNRYEKTPTDGKLSNLNIIFVDNVSSDAYSLKQQKQFNKILKSQLK